MAINKAVKLLLKALSYANDSIEVEKSRKLADLKKLDPMRIFVKKLDEKIYNDGHEVPVRIYFPSEEAMDKGIREGHAYPILLFFHGGGWVTESVENYDRVCAQMAQSTGHIVVSVEYRLAPEYKFPVGLTDCYAVAREIFMNRFILNTDPEKITLIGDSAGGNLTAAVCLMARDRGEFSPKRQILIYPAVGNDYTESSPYASVQKNGKDYLLTARHIEDYMTLYQSNPKDRENPYFSPLEADNFDHLPKTLVLTVEFDPLRDEGEAYAKKLMEAGNDVEVHRIADALHGYFALGIKHLHVQESFDLINKFLNEALQPGGTDNPVQSGRREEPDIGGKETFPLEKA
ncbi:MAG: alpha/beta hydrolase [Clostridiales bacterium]|nr:alpha/beta hydrolase [Clostridiales bacterium]